MKLLYPAARGSSDDDNTNRRGRPWLAALLIATSLLTAGVPAGQHVSANTADQIEQLKRQIQQYQQRLQQSQRQQQQAREALRQLQRQQQSVLSELNQLDQSLAKTNEELAQIEAKLRDAEERLAQARVELQQAEERLAYRNELLGRRLRAIAEHGSIAYLDVLLSSSSFRDFLSRFELLRQIIGQDVALLEQVKADREAVIAKKEQIEKERQQIAQLRSELLAKRQQLEVVTAERRDRYQQLEQSEEQYREMLAAEERASREAERLLQAASAELAKLLPKDAGAFTVFPVDRTGTFRVSSRFGRRFHPIIREYRMHNGVDFAKPSGSNIYAVADGRVVYAGVLGGYGNTVIIAHSSTISTLYAHASKILVSVGQSVKAGQTIALVGATGTATGPHLHFEVRKNGTPVDPMPYLP